MRILLDTNVIFSALITEGNERYLIEKIIASYNTIVFTDFIIDEIETVLSRKLSEKAAVMAKAILKDIQNEKLFYTKRRAEYKKFIPMAKELINEKDAPILAAGLQPEINILVSGDNDFLQNKKLAAFRKKKIYNTIEALNLL